MIRAWFSTFIYSEPLMGSGLGRFNADLAVECLALRDYDREGRAWSRRNYPGGYTSYASMNELHRFSSTFSGLERRITRHVRAFARALDMDLRGREIRMTDCWVNIMPPGVVHGLHLHPLSTLSGTFYVQTPRGSPGLKLEDPRLDRMMAAPPRRRDAARASRPWVLLPVEAGQLVLFESWLRHEVAPNGARSERVSVSFNYSWF